MTYRNFFLGALGLWLVASADARAALVTGEILAAATQQPVAARLYIQDAGGEWFFASSAATNGTAIPYARTNRMHAASVECHTTLSAHPFQVELPPGRYTFTIERGKEFHPLKQPVSVGTHSITLKFELSRWVNMAERNWFSGEGHVHRSLVDLPTLVLAEDLNVALPETYWAIEAFTPPTHSPKNGTPEIPATLIRADATHVIWPRNTEYEIYRFSGKVHNLGGVFILNHREPFTLGAPPMLPIAQEAHRQGALLDLDKHDRAWSLMLVPVMNIDLFELANNCLWRTEFAFTNFNLPAPAFMNLPNLGQHGSERDWMDYGFQSYYTLLDCGFRLRPTAGCASGVHPVPPGFGRVYVHCLRGFTYDDWIKGLDAGRSFVTTGPMLLARINGEVAGTGFKLRPGESRRVEITATVLSEEPTTRLELIVNGTVIPASALKQQRNTDGALESLFTATVQVTGTSWIALRCWAERADGRVRFAHTAPSWFDDASRPLRPRREQAAWLVERMQQEVEANTGILPPAAVDEFRRAKLIYERILETAR